MYTPSARAQIVTRRTYNRPLNPEGTKFETWEETINRVINYQLFLWERQLGSTLIQPQIDELQELRLLMLDRKALTSGRSLWMANTETVKRREASNFNCAFSTTQTVHDVVDQLWLLLQGCGVGFKMESGTLSGFPNKKEVEIVRSTKVLGDNQGRSHNIESCEGGTWTIDVGDSAEAWAKAAGKLIVGNYRSHRLRISFTEVRAPGQRLKGYGWLCSGDGPISIAFRKIADIRNRRSGQTLTKLDLLDVMNHLGTILSTRRSAECALMDFGDPEWEDFAMAKYPGFYEKEPQRSQSNNGLCFWEKPSFKEILNLMTLMADQGGSEPSFNNCEAALRRAPWFAGFNPCYEILLANRGFCNLCEIFVHRFKNNFSGLLRATYLIARANYRQTLVNLHDGILQRAWHENNQVLRLCGTGLTGLGSYKMTPYDFKTLRNMSVHGAYSMADELGTEWPHNVTCMKPSGTLSKIGDAPTEGMNFPLGRFVFNNIAFDKHDPLLPILQEAGYHSFPHPTDPACPILVCFPVEYDNSYLKSINGKILNQESAVDQLNRYKLLNSSYVEQNTSCTISWDKSELKEISRWLDTNWDSYIGAAFVFRNDLSRSANDLGYPYLPQEVVTEKVYHDYLSTLKEFDLGRIGDVSSFDLPLDVTSQKDCPTGSCPIK